MNELREVKCSDCNSSVHILGTAEQWNRYITGAEKIQSIFPELDAEKREILISGICGKCFDKLFEGE